MQLAEQAWDAGKKERNMVVKLSIFCWKIGEGGLSAPRQTLRQRKSSFLSNKASLKREGPKNLNHAACG
jgi:hypothetical protein